MPLPHNQ